MRGFDRGEQLNRSGPTAMLCHTGRREFLLQLLTAVCGTELPCGSREERVRY